MIKWIINNYQLGSKLHMTPIDKIVSQKRLDKSHTEVVYDGLTDNQKAFIQKVFARKGIEV